LIKPEFETETTFTGKAF